MPKRSATSPPIIGANPPPSSSPIAMMSPDAVVMSAGGTDSAAIGPPGGVGGGWRVSRNLDQLAIAVAARELHQAETVAEGIEAHGLRVNRHDRAKVQIRGQIAAMQPDVHRAPLS